MTDSNFSDRPDDRDQQRPQSEVTHRFDTAAFASPSPQRETAGPGLVARVATISLVVGVLAGVAGAAGYSAVDDLVGDDVSISSPAAESPNTAVSTSQDTTAEDGLATLLVAEAIYRSAERGQRERVPSPADILHARAA